MITFSRILFRTSPRAPKRAPGGTVMLEFDSSVGPDGNLLVTLPDGTARPFGGNAREGTPKAGVKAVKTLTNASATTKPLDGDTVTIGSKVYTFQTTLTNVNGNVKISADADATTAATESMTNLFNAINGTGGTPGTDYATLMTANPTFVATNPSATTVVITAKTAGLAATSATTEEDSAELSWANTTAGVDGTPASKGDMLFDATNFYFASTDLTTASLTGWRKITHAAI